MWPSQQRSRSKLTGELTGDAPSKLFNQTPIYALYSSSTSVFIELIPGVTYTSRYLCTSSVRMKKLPRVQSMYCTRHCLEYST
mmetsp:Transcript_1309/g.2122  ORF Transcript_1309/g.2122 Transcript_1309/m.2122 type:complete len:83 (+) Transcript_1309:368-616(+)